MYCSNCGGKIVDDAKFCEKCGVALESKPTPKKNGDEKTKKKNYGLLGGFNINDEELKLQVENHDTLPILKSARGIAVMTITGLLIIGLALVVVLNLTGSDAQISYSDAFWSLVMYAPLLYFVYKGHLWAIVVLGIFYTLDKVVSAIVLSPDHFNIGSLFFWLIGIAPLWVAFRVERAYRKQEVLKAASNL